MSSKKIDSIIGEIERLGNSLKDRRGGPFPTDLLSILGELQVYQELQNRFSKAELIFKRKARADILMILPNEELNIEVKTSSLKDEDYGEGYGFALQLKKCKKHPEAFFEHSRRGKIKGDFCYLDYLICVASNHTDLLKPDFYIFSREELQDAMPQIINRSKRFWFSPCRILLPVKPDKSQKGEIYGDFDLKLIDNNGYKNNWEKIK